MDCRVTFGIDTPPWDSHEPIDDWYMYSKLLYAKGVRSERMRGRTRQDDAREALGTKSTIDTSYHAKINNSYTIEQELWPETLMRPRK